jgi:hypothetical protein
MTIAAFAAATSAAVAVILLVIGRPRRARTPAVQAVVLTGPTITAILHKGQTLDANLTGAMNPHILLWLVALQWCFTPLLLLVGASYRSQPGQDTGWINAPIRLIQEWTMGKALLMTIAASGLIMVPWLWHLIDPRYETPT